MTKLFYPFILIAVFPFLTTYGQSKTLTEDAVIIKELVQFNKSYFSAYNECNVEKLTSICTKDIEFYHDLGGALFGIESLSNQIEKFCDSDYSTIADYSNVKTFILRNRAEVYGGIITGELSFTSKNKSDGAEKFLGTSKYTLVLSNQSNLWKISRFLSYDHQSDSN
ncbi:MAG: hypothetical protein R3321_12150 [Nitrososphaeraceae archaeon]|nr:hypothetical protein [Nitrososphaeraceae archaeon]